MWVLSNENETHVSLMLFYCLKAHIREEEVKHWQNFVYYFLDGLLQTLPRIRKRLIKSSFDLLLYKALQIIFNYSLWTKNMWKSKTRVTSSDERFMSSNKLQVRIMSYELISASYEFKSTSYELKSTSYKFKSTSYKFKSTSYEFKPRNYEFTSMSLETKSISRKIKSMGWEIKSTS